MNSVSVAAAMVLVPPNTQPWFTTDLTDSQNTADVVEKERARLAELNEQRAQLLKALGKLA